MSNTIFAMLVWDVKSTKLRTYLKQKKIISYTKSVSDNVMAIAAKEITENGEKTSLQTSLDLQTRTVLLVHSEDFGWGFNSYFKGEHSRSFYLDYDALGDQIVWTEDTLWDFTAHPDRIAKLSECLNSAEEEMIYKNSWNLWIEALGIDIDDDYNFDSLKELPEGVLLNSGIEIISPPQGLSYKKLIKKHIEPYMMERGYIKNTTNVMPYDYCYFKNVNGIYVGLMMDQNKDYIYPFLKTLLGQVEVLSPTARIKSDEELEQFLIYLTDKFEEKTNEYRDELSFEIFDTEQVFKEHMDGYMLKKGYEVIESSISQLPDGKILYRRRDHDIEFAHSPIYLAIFAYYSTGDDRTAIMIRDQAGNSMRRSFKNQAEYIKILENYKKELEKL